MEIAGIDTDHIVSSLMEIERRPIDLLTARREAAIATSQAIGQVCANVEALRIAAAELSDVGAFEPCSTADLADEVAALVKAANMLLADIEVQTRCDLVNRTLGPLATNGDIRGLAEQLRRAMAGPFDTDSTPSCIGVDVSPDGSYTFDRSILLTTTARTRVDFQSGAAARVVALALALTRPVTGTLTGAQEVADRRVQDLNDQMRRLQERVTLREQNFRRRYSNLQTVLCGLHSQRCWLSSQIAGHGDAGAAVMASVSVSA